MKTGLPPRPFCTMARAALLALTFGIASGCAYLRSPVVPMPTLTFASPSGAADTLIVLLPGLGDGPQTFVDRGFVDLVHQAVPDADIVAADAHINYYRERSVLERLHHDVITPRSAQYENVWLVGISLGGLGATLYATAHPDTVAGIILLAPFLGEGEALTEITTAGGLADWTPPEATAIAAMPETLERRTYELWSGLQRWTAREHDPQVYVGWGTADDFAATNALLADALPKGHHATQPGGHSWGVWRPLLSRLLETAQP